jgi:hypothetical protein
VADNAAAVLGHQGEAGLAARPEGIDQAGLILLAERQPVGLVDRSVVAGPLWTHFDALAPSPAGRSGVS